MATLIKLFQRSFTYVKHRGIDVLRDPRINKGTAFNLKERQLLGIHGLLPPGVNTIEEQALRCMINLRKIDDDLNRHLFLISLQDRNEDLFYKVVTDNIEYCLPIIYTPTVGLACQKYGLMFRRPRGLYITIHDKMYIKSILDNWPEQIVRAIVVSDGERILGLGDLGAYGMGIPVGKLSLYTALAGVPPSKTLPVLLDVGTNNQDLLDDPLYLGVRHKRIRGQMYFEFMDAFMQAVVEKYGRQCLIQFEDFANQNAFKILSKYRNHYCTFNDDIQGTASVTVGGLLGACKIAKRQLRDNVFLFQGAGSAATGIALLLKRALIESGDKEEDAISKIYMFDIDGLLVKNRDLDVEESRAASGFSPQNQIFVKDMKHHRTLAEAVKEIKPTAMIGAAGVPGVFTPHILNMLTTFTDRPIVFALSNPTSKSECTAIDAYTHTDGKCIYACGSPFDPVHYKDKVFIPSQCNNSYIFPGLALAIVMFQIRPVTEDLFIRAAETLAKQVSDEDLAQGRVFPALWTIKDVSLEIAVTIAEHAYTNGIANHRPEPRDKREFILKHWYNPIYLPSLPNPYKYPLN